MSMITGRTWTPQEDKILESLYGKIRIEDMVHENLIPDRTERAIAARAHKIGLKSGMKNTLYKNIRLDFFKNPTVEAAYWSGFLCADGCLVKDPNKKNTYRLCLSLQRRDEEHLLKFKRAMGHDGPIGRMTQKGHLIGDRMLPESEMSFVNICQAGRFLDDLIALGIVPQKTKRINPPKLNDIVLKLAYLRGYIDGDGTITLLTSDGVSRMGIRITSSSKEILEWFKSLVEEAFPTRYMDREFSTVVPTAIENCWAYGFTGYRAYRIFDILSRLPTPVMERKWLQPRVLELLAENKSKANVADQWSIRLPIEDQIDAYFAQNPQNLQLPS